MNRLFFYKRPETIKEKLIAEIEHKKGKENFRKIIEMTSEKTKLKPCPFCGGEAKVMGSDSDPFFMVVCLKCGLKAKWYHDLRDEATIHWNERNYLEKQDSSNVANTNKSCEKSCKEENATCKKSLQLTRKNIEQMVNLEWQNNTHILIGEVFFEITFDKYEKRFFLSINDENYGFGSLEKARGFAKEWVVDFICSALRVEE